MTINDNEITAGLWLQYTWFRHEGPDPVGWRDADVWETRKQEEKAAWSSLMDEVHSIAPVLETTATTLHERFGIPPLVRKQRAELAAAMRSTWPGWYEPRDMIAMAMGAPEPKRVNNIWWHDRGHYPLEKVESTAEVARLRVPDWPHVASVQRMLDSRERWQRARPHEPAPGTDITQHLMLPRLGEAPTISYPSFVDLGVYLMGATRFFTVLGGEPELADALMDFCFALSAGYTDFLLALSPAHFVGLCAFGGDATFFLSPTLYDRYSAAWDLRIFDYVRARHGLSGDMPCNLHSCGASSHLYARWGHHPLHDNIGVMQTRLIPGTVKQLRDALPSTRLELTLHPPEFDLATAEPDAIRAVMRQSASDAGGRDMHFSFITAAHRPEELPRIAEHLEVVLEEMEMLV